jgi:hypothetical protein
MAWAPAHIIVIDADGWRVYFDGGFGDFVFGSLVGGPEVTSAYIGTLFLEGSSAVSGPPVELVDRYRTGVVIDETRRELLWFCSGSDTWSTSMVLRRVWLRLLAAMWPGWRIRWAYRGAGDLAGYLDLGRYTLTRDHHLEADQPVALDADEALVDANGPPERYRSGCYALVTVREPGGRVRAWPVAETGQPADHPAWAGKSLLDRLPGDGWTAARLAIPTSGLHVDIPGRWVGVWTTTYLASLLDEMPCLWPGWQVVFWEDRYEEHATAIAGSLEIAICDERAAVLGKSLPNGYRLLGDTAGMISPPPGDHDPAMLRRAQDTLSAAATQVVAQLTHI